MPDWGLPSWIPFFGGGEDGSDAGNTGGAHPWWEPPPDLLERLRELATPPPPPGDTNVTPPITFPDPLPGDYVNPETTPPPRTNAENYPYNIPPGIIVREGSRLSPSQARTALGLSSLPSAIRESLPTQPQRRPALRATPGRSRSRRTARTRTRDLFAGALPGLGFRPRVIPPRPAPTRPPARTDQPAPFPDIVPGRLPGDRSVRDPRITLPRLPMPRELEEAFPFPWPELPPPTKKPPPVIAPAPRTPTTPGPSIPPIRIAPPPAPQLPPPLPQRTPPAPTIPPPAPQRTAPPPSRTAPPAPTRAPQTLGAASILGPILRRRRQSSTSLLRQFTAPFDPVQTPPGDLIRQETPPAIARVETIADALPSDPLTRLMDPALGLQQQARTREEECKCEETEEEKEQNRRPSNVLAKVKSFTRRMSQNSLDNLRD
jgi:hypothetical protein